MHYDRLLSNHSAEFRFALKPNFDFSGNYLAIYSMSGIPSLLCLFSLLCTVTDFSAGALPIGVKFCTAVWAHLGQVFSYFGG